MSCALQRETSVLFFCAICPKDFKYLVIVECTTPGRFQRRKEFWENEGFYLHPYVKHSGHFHTTPRSVFVVNVCGNMEFFSESGCRLNLTFSPRSYKYQSFYISKVNKKAPFVGEVNIYETIDGKTPEDAPMTKLPIEIYEDKSCIMS